MKPLTALLLAALPLTACATAGKPSGALSSYEGLTPRTGTLRTGIAERKSEPDLTAVRRVMLEPARMAPGPETGWLNDKERALLLRELDAQMCFEITERYELTYDPAQADARVRAVVTRVRPTGRFASTASAAAGFFIPGPIGLRVPGTLGGLGAEAEMVTDGGRQVAALVWNRDATAVGTDDPSLSRLGDALQFAEPFADVAAATMTPKGLKSRKIESGEDPCAQFGPRFRPEGFLAGLASGLYVPQMSGAKAVPKEAPKDDGA
ncbi:MAG: DUF3313 domain-containing protein [Phenylobacterium sp.]|uniref:DUF3313 family protein n=1 Tax=Phenylobacterium sp. TaxID=1871053 RepID=UPI00120DE09B|nr:DUF3313 family protein [Phenylobacterium sp.]TAJ74335.1 MAG: DUF3313 domain-containing protein [Phenylobacterium sp.]